MYFYEKIINFSHISSYYMTLTEYPCIIFSCIKVVLSFYFIGFEIFYVYLQNKSKTTHKMR